MTCSFPDLSLLNRRASTSTWSCSKNILFELWLSWCFSRKTPPGFVRVPKHHNGSIVWSRLVCFDQSGRFIKCWNVVCDTAGEELGSLLLTVRADTNQTNCLLESVGTCTSIVSGAALPSGRRCIYIEIMNIITGSYQSNALPDVYMVCLSWCTF